MSSRKTSKKAEALSIFQYDKQIRRNYRVIAGLDEAGRGPLAGPVVAAAVILPEGLVIGRLRDSKKIPAENERKTLFWKIALSALSIGVGVVEADVIDSINILEATKLAMKLAVADLNAAPDILLIDAVKLPGLPFQQKSIIRGESVSASIAAASIIAKVARDEIMLGHHERYPEYNFKNHKGYSTKEHMECINKFGSCPIHRKSFRKVIDVQLPF